MRHVVVIFRRKTPDLIALGSDCGVKPILDQILDLLSKKFADTTRVTVDRMEEEGESQAEYRTSKEGGKNPFITKRWTILPHQKICRVRDKEDAT